MSLSRPVAKWSEVAGAGPKALYKLNHTVCCGTVLIVCVQESVSPIQKPPVAKWSKSADNGPNAQYEPNHAGHLVLLWSRTTSDIERSEVLKLDYVCKSAVFVSHPFQWTSKARPPAMDQKHCTNQTALVVWYCFNFKWPSVRWVRFQP